MTCYNNPARQPNIQSAVQKNYSSHLVRTVVFKFLGPHNFFLLFWFYMHNFLLSSDEDSGSNKGSAPGSRTSTPEPRSFYRDKKEAMEAFKEFLKEKVKLLLDL